MLGFQKQKAGIGSNMMQSYVERQLGSIHGASAPAMSNYKEKIVSFLLGAVAITLLPYFHIGIFHLKFWVPDKAPVMKNNCTCSCFDTVMRGEYENPGRTRYKHIYFNATWQTFRIWMFTIVFVLLAYESIKYIIPLVRKRKFRTSMFVLNLVNIYPHYYSWWSYFSYYNEDFYRYFKHHMWFTVTEMITTCIVLNLTDIKNEIVSWKILAIVSINVMHILVGGMDQFISDVIYGQGANFHKARNIALMIPDVMHVVVPLWELFRFAKRKDLRINELCYKEELSACFVFVCLGTLMGRLL
ncbi:uncharacterized protein LOC128220129 isoform X2 [Mya arenaria]|nr:uncharacterized protein LOC128220129 isoform X2 [Mya arenaria]XP_052784356.1 uncharacterized protein LOC128220129 isoform X2 [Mya arenaria]XP_052784357.1 uncharacterized protein LOC128220129 isoform X2 [Mya arenaria]XP_052784358.1 uncharacterized protein LOC128220129 isoform X2 [Mya arenaria]XP_052784359.1 uncharacterized protein LOC128220129 isoform X2 [Mya arenaria]